MFQGIMSGLKPATLGLIGTAALSLATPENFIDWKSFVLFIGAFMASFWGRVNPIATIIAGGVIGLIIY
jgi:chromate transporter